MNGFEPTFRKTRNIVKKINVIPYVLNTKRFKKLSLTEFIVHLSGDKEPGSITIPAPVPSAIVSASLSKQMVYSFDLQNSFTAPTGIGALPEHNDTRFE